MPALSSLATFTDVNLQTCSQGWLTAAERLWLPCGPNRNVVHVLDVDSLPTIVDLGSVAANQPQDEHGFDPVNTIMVTRRNSATRLYQVWDEAAGGDVNLASASYSNGNDSVGSSGGVFVRDNILYETHSLNAVNASGDDGYIVDVTNPAAPVALTGINLSYLPGPPMVANDRLYIPRSATQLDVYNVTTPAAPTFVATVTLTGALLTGETNEWRVADDETFAVNLARGTLSVGRISVVDLTTPNTPALAATINAPSGASTTVGRGLMFLDGSTLYVLTLDTGPGSLTHVIRQYDLSTPASPVLSDTFTLPMANTREPRAVWILDGHPIVLTADATDGFVDVLESILPSGWLVGAVAF